MADLDWRDKYLAHLTCINIADTMFFLSLWELHNPCSFHFVDGRYAIRVEAFPNYSHKIISYKECKKGLMFVGTLPANDVDNPTFRNKLKNLILQFFYSHPGIIEDYNRHHIPKERIIMT